MKSILKINLIKVFIFTLIFSFILIPFSSRTYADFTKAKITTELTQESGITNPIERLVFAPVKINTVLKLDQQKYSQEIAYFFYKLGFKASPVSHILFEDGNIIEVNSNWKINQFENSYNTGTIFVLLAYADNFNLNSFNNSLSEFNNSVLKNNLPTIDINSTDNITLNKFIIEKDESFSQISFSDYDSSIQSDLAGYFSNQSFTNKTLPDISIEKISELNDLDSNAVVNMKIDVKNNSDFDFIFSEENQVKFSFEKDSEFYVNNTWLNQRTAVIQDTGFIKANSTSTFSVPLQTPLLPGDYKGEIILSLKDKSFGSSEFTLKVEDSGQKVLRILESGLGYLNVRQEPNVNSSELGKVTTGNLYLYTDQQDGYYKINFDGKEGWVLARYVQTVE